MIDPKLVEKQPEFVLERLRRRNPGHTNTMATVNGFMAERRNLITEIDNANREVKAISGEYRKASAGLGSTTTELRAIMDRSEAVSLRRRAWEDRLRVVQETLDHYALLMPNLPADDVPVGDETNNVVVRTVGTVPVSPWTKDHVELGFNLKQMDFDTAAKISGTRFVILRGALAKMERALVSFMLDRLEGAGFEEYSVPNIVNGEAAKGTGQWPMFADDMYTARELSNPNGPLKLREIQFFIPTAELPLTNLVNDTIVDEAVLPMKVCAHTPCYRLEAGSSGRDTRGMIRQHQFQKVEMVAITRPEESEAMHDKMLATAESILAYLGLPYRVVLLAAGDMGFSAQKTYDLEVWLPSQGCYREISSISNCGDFQARRMKARYRPQGAKHPELLHTLNGSALAVGRTLVAIMENYQREDGGIEIPPFLRPYMNHKTAIGPDGVLT